MSDNDLEFSKRIGWAGGNRALRYAILIDNGKVSYAEKDAPKSLEVSGAEAILSRL